MKEAEKAKNDRFFQIKKYFTYKLWATWSEERQISACISDTSPEIRQSRSSRGIYLRPPCWSKLEHLKFLGSF